MGHKSPRIVTVNVQGRDEKSPLGQDRRVALVDQVGEYLSRDPRSAPIDAVVFPGGFGYLADHNMVDALAKDRMRNLDHPLAEAAHKLAQRLSRNGRSSQIIMGFDTAHYTLQDHQVGGQQLVLAFNQKAVSGYARKIFPVDEDVDGKTMSPFVLYQSDYDDARRVISLANGSKAILCVCYDMFGIADTLRNKADKMRKAVHVADRAGVVTSDKVKLLQDSFAAFQKFLLAERPDVAISTIHRFAGAGRDIFWQRHGIAAASAALGTINRRTSFAIAAAHIRLMKESDVNACRLAAWNVPVEHLSAGSQRQTHTRDQRSTYIINERGQPQALIRVFQP